MRAGAMAPPPPNIGLGPGVVRSGSPLAGNLAVQGRIELDERSGLLDDVVDARWLVICADGEPHEVLGDDQTAFVEGALRGRLVSLDRTRPGGARDLDGALTAWLADADAAAIVARPDGYVFGAVTRLTELPALIDDLSAQLTGTVTTSQELAGSPPTAPRV
jgi:flavoprotein hydroxylase